MEPLSAGIQGEESEKEQLGQDGLAELDVADSLVRQLLIGEQEAGQRCDAALAPLLGLSRSHVQKLLAEERVRRQDGRPLKANYRLRLGEELAVELPAPQPTTAQPEELPLDIVYEDEDVIVVNKARGMVTHPAPGNPRGTLVNALLYHCPSLSGINGVIRPGIVHRLDKDTSGLLVCAKNDRAHLALSQQIQDKRCQRRYIAIVRGNVKEDQGTVDTLLARSPQDRKKMAVVREGGRRALTYYQVLERFGRYTIVQCILGTGRTHQIRVHMEYLGHPLVGDPKYSPLKTGFAIKGQALHGAGLSFYQPRTGELLEFTAPLPEDMAKIVTRLRQHQFS